MTTTPATGTAIKLHYCYDPHPVSRFAVCLLHVRIDQSLQECGLVDVATTTERGQHNLAEMTTHREAMANR